MKQVFWHGLKHNTDPVDKFTTLHFLSGIVFGLVLIPLLGLLVAFIITLAISVCFETIENPLKRRQHIYPPTPDESVQNAVMDVVFLMFGWFVGCLILLLL